MLDQNAPGVRKHAQNSALFPLVAPAQYLHRIVAANINTFVCCRCTHKKVSKFRVSQFEQEPRSKSQPKALETWKLETSKTCVYNTSGAKLTIFKNFFSRNSLATGPNTRVPTGSPASLISTAAFWSKRM